MEDFTFSGSHGTRMTKTVSIMKRCVKDKLEINVVVLSMTLMCLCRVGTSEVNI